MFNVLLLKVFSLFTMILDCRDDKLVYIIVYITERVVYTYRPMSNQFE